MRFLLLLVVLLLACGDGANTIPGADSSLARAEAGSRAIAPKVDSAPAPTRVFGRNIGFRSRKQLNDHVVKHGAEFGGVSASEYLRLAQTLRDTSLSEDVLESTRADGTISRFQRSTGAFIAFNADGTIRTFFIPNDGEKYFLRQARRRPLR